MNAQLFTVFIATSLVIFVPSVYSQCDDGWVAFANAKCYKLFDDYVDRDKAEEKCQQGQLGEDEPSLGLIKTNAEQKFVSNYVFNVLGVTDGVWIGARRIDNETNFLWNDETDVVHANWASGFPTDDERRECVRIVSDLTRGPRNGDWMDTTCSARNLVLCQKLQNWSLVDIRKQLLDVREKMIPIGFIYTELPGHPTPSKLWPYLQWQEISESFAGDFFRVVGQGSEPFGIAQDECAPRLSQLPAGSNFANGITFTGHSKGSESDNLKGVGQVKSETLFHMTDCEIRPQNQAVRVWKRIA